MEAFMNWKVAGMAGTALVAVAVTGMSAFAASDRFTGSVSLGVSQSFEDDDFSLGPISLFDDSFTSLSGDAKINIAFSGGVNLQLGFQANNSFVDSQLISFDRETSFQGDAHLYYRTDRWALGVFGGAGVANGPSLFIVQPDAEYYWVGVEGQYYWSNFTLGLAGGYLDSSTDGLQLFTSADDLFVNNAWFADAELRWYVSPKFALVASGGYLSGDSVFGNVDVETWKWGAKAEYYPEEKDGLSLWVAYEGRTTSFELSGSTTEFDKDVHTVKVGVTFHFGSEGGTASTDRSGPAWNSTDYGAIVVGG
jgi:hypothetical protein